MEALEIKMTFRAIKTYQTSQRLNEEYAQDEAGVDALNSRWVAVGEAYQALEMEQKRGQTPEEGASWRKSLYNGYSENG